MAQTVTFKSLPRNAVLSQENYDWLQGCLGTPLPLFQITFDRYGQVSTLAVYKDDSCISIFMIDKTECEISLPSTIANFKEYTEIKRKCIRCGQVAYIKADTAGYRKYLQGIPIQYALHELSEDDREWLLSSVCPKCWDELTKDLEEPE